MPCLPNPLLTCHILYSAQPVKCSTRSHTHLKKPKPNHKSTHVSVVRSVLAKLGRAAQQTLPKMGLLIRER